MTYYSVSSPPSRFTLARAAQVANELQAIADGFAMLPAEAALKRGRVQYAATVGGTANAITVTMTHTMTGPLVAGDMVLFKAAADNTDAATLNVDGTGAIAIRQPDGSALAAGNIQQDGVALVVYNGTYWVLVGGYLSASQQALAAIAAEIATVAGIAANVTTVAGVAADVTTVAGIAGALALGAMQASSSTSLSVGTGVKSLTVQTGRAFVAGLPVVIAHDTANLMAGEVQTYSSGSGAMTVNVHTATGSGTYAAWGVTVSGPRGATGAGFVELADEDELIAVVRAL